MHRRRPSFWICAHVFVLQLDEGVRRVSCRSRNGRVDMIQSTIHATSVDLPMPWPEAIAFPDCLYSVDAIKTARQLLRCPTSIRTLALPLIRSGIVIEPTARALPHGNTNIRRSRADPHRKRAIAHSASSRFAWWAVIHAFSCGHRDARQSQSGPPSFPTVSFCGYPFSVLLQFLTPGATPGGGCRISSQVPSGGAPGWSMNRLVSLRSRSAGIQTAPDRHSSSYTPFMARSTASSSMQSPASMPACANAAAYSSSSSH